MEKQKIVIFCRSATSEQLALQVERLTKYAEENNCEVVAVVQEQRTGVSNRRWKWRLAMRLAKRYEASLLVADLSRVARDSFVASRYAMQLRHRRIKLFSAMEGIKKDQVENMLAVVKVISWLTAPQLSST